MAHRSRLSTLLIDCDSRLMNEAVAFWAAALGRERSADDPPGSRYLNLVTPAGPTLDLVLQATTPDEAGVHFDIETDDVDAEVRRLEKLGAKRKRFVKEWWVMEAPSGHSFCVVPVQSRHWPDGAVEWPNAD